MLRKIWYVFGALLLLILSIGAYFYFTKNEPLPKGEAGPAAEALADDMLEALNYEEYKKISRIQWTFRDAHHFDWQKVEGKVTVRWDNLEVDLTISDRSGIVLRDGQAVEGDEKAGLLEQAYGYFANDSFWLLAPFKIRDAGTTRKLVKTDDRGDALLVTYSSGGVTPGDSYLWILGANNRPVAYKMWVQIIPVGGMEFSWEEWVRKKNVWFAPIHKGEIGEVNITNLRVE